MLPLEELLRREERRSQFELQRLARFLPSLLL